MPSCASSERRTSSTSSSTSACAIWSRNAISPHDQRLHGLERERRILGETLDHGRCDALEIVGLGDVRDDAQLVEALGRQRVARAAGSCAW